MSEPKQYRKKPVVIEALRWTGENIDEALAFMPPEQLPKAPDDPHVNSGVGFVPPLGTLDIPTLEGTMRADPGDWIIRGVKGEFYPCKPDIFDATYEPVCVGGATRAAGRNTVSEQTSRDEAVRVGAEAMRTVHLDDWMTKTRARITEQVLDAAHAAGLISYQDEWVQAILPCDEVLLEDGREWRCGSTTFYPHPEGLGPVCSECGHCCAHDRVPIFVRRVSFEAGEEVNEEQT